MLLHTLLNIFPGKKPTLAFTYLTVLILLFSLPIPASAAAGDLDASFGQNGVTAPPGFPGTGFATAITNQPDGKIIAGGMVPIPPGGFPGFGLVRYLPGGAIDSGFGTNGRVVTSLNEYTSTGATMNDIAVLPDGKIVIAGSVRVPGGAFSQYVAFVIRYNSDGSLDTTFNGNGKYIYEEGGVETSAEAIKVLPDGKFLVAGYTGGAIKGSVPYKGLLFRFAGNNLDSAFASGGISITPAALGEMRHYSIALLPDNKILVGGAVGGNSPHYFSITRYNADGTIDSAFGTNGRITRTESFFSEAVEVLIQPDGKIAGICSVNPRSDSSDIIVFRFNQDGTSDASFGTNGKVVTAVTNLADVARAGALQTNGKIIVAGYSYNVNTGAGYNPLVIRYNSDGTLDRTFGTGGIVRQPSTAQLDDMLLQEDGKILGVGNPFNSIDFPGFKAIRYLANGTREFDFDGDRKSDVSIFRPNFAAEWYWLNSSTNQSSGLQFGVSSDKVVPADYDGDGKTDIAVFRDGDWYRINSSGNQFVAVHFGQAADIPVPADFDGDGRADLAVYRAGIWYILNSSDNSFRADQFGISSDKPVIGDYDGDGKTDLAVYRDGTWYQMRSREGFYAAQFGISSDKPVPADYDSDGKTDLAVYRPSDGAWYLLRSHLGFTATQFGISTDKAVPADYDGDGKTDLGVYRDGNWYLLRSQQGFIATQFGSANDTPVPNAFVP